jgi:hypothetical protein
VFKKYCLCLVFQMSIPCTGREKGISTLILGLQIFNKNRRPIKGSPMKLTLKKHCEAFGETLADIFTCLIIFKQSLFSPQI